MRALSIALAAAAGLFVAADAAPAAAQSGALDPRHAACELAVADAAARHGVPYEILRALAFVESGRTRNGSRGPWPWTINLEGEGRYFETRAEAEAFAAAALVDGRRSFDAGCMQINYRWHGDAFESFRQMFDPAANADYAARFLGDLFAETGDWLTAAGYYHSRTPEHTQRYRGLVERRLARLAEPPARPVLLAALDGSAPAAPAPAPAAPPAQVETRVAGLAPELALQPRRRPDRRAPAPAPAPSPAPIQIDGPAIVLAALAPTDPAAASGSASLFGSASGGWRGLLREPPRPLLAAAPAPAPDAAPIDAAAPVDPLDGVVELSPDALQALDALDGRIDAPEEQIPSDDPGPAASDPQFGRAISAGGVGLGALPRGRPFF